MFCSCSKSAVGEGDDSRRLKEGELQRWKSGMFSSKWAHCYAVLLSNSNLMLFNKNGDSKPVEQILLRDVAPYICVGQITEKMPTKRPTLPEGSSIQHLVGIGMDKSAQKVHWILFPTDSELESWFAQIVKTLPQPQQSNGDEGGNSVQPVDTEPQPSAQSTNGGQSVRLPPINNGSMAAPAAAYPPAPPYPQEAPANTTVIVERGGESNGGGPGFGTGLLAGGLLGYGIGSFFEPHPIASAFPGVGGGYENNGNTTYVTNNYYNSDPNAQNNDNQQQQPTNNPDPQPQPDPTEQQPDYDYADMTDGAVPQNVNNDDMNDYGGDGAEMYPDQEEIYDDDGLI